MSFSSSSLSKAFGIRLADGRCAFGWLDRKGLQTRSNHQNPAVRLQRRWPNLVTLKTEYCWGRFAGYLVNVCLMDRIPFIAVLFDKRTWLLSFDDRAEINRYGRLGGTTSSNPTQRVLANPARGYAEKMVAFQAVRSAGLPLACRQGVSRGVGRPHGRDWRYGPVSPRARLLRRCLRR